MNFDDIKKEMDASVNEVPKQSIEIDLTKGECNPVQIIRKNMKGEILTQLVGIVFLLSYSAMIQMDAFSRSTYLIFMAITSLMTLSYVIKLSFFVKKTSDFTSSTKEALLIFMFEAKLTLEVYKSFMIAGSLLLPVPILALFTRELEPLKNGITIFEKWFRLDLSGGELSILISVYLVSAIGFYYLTTFWAHMKYGKYLKQLQSIIDDFSID
tara:strand:+ start:1915 stop:2550 length:636 start_codon:yes stop_codon:yes gene_type:complete